MKSLLGRFVPAMALSGILVSCGGGGESTPPATFSATPDAATLSWNESMTVDVLANDKASRGTSEVVSVTTPEHGTAAVSAGKLVYTPRAGYFGEDRLSYTARATESGATATADVKLTVNAAMRLEGRLATPAMAGASVTVSVGTQTRVVTADAAGTYAAAISTANPADMVTIVASGAGANSRVKLTSLAGDAATLAKLADVHGVLSSERVPSINVSPLTSALAALVVEANAGRAPADAGTLQALMFGQPPQRVIDLATIISLIADQTVELPAGVADTLALIKQPSSPELKALLKVEAESDSWRLERYDAARSSVTSNTIPSGTPRVAGAGPEDRAYVAAFRAASPPGALFVSYRPDGTATVATGTGASAGTWRVSEGVIRIALAKPVQTAWYDVDPYSFEVTNYRDDVTGLEVRQFAGTSRWGMAVVTRTGTTTALDGPGVGAKQPIEDAGSVVSLLDPALAAPLTTAEFTAGTRWAGVILDARFDDYAKEADTLEILGDSNARMVRTGASVAWSVSNGWLRVIQGSLDRRYLRLSRNAASGEEHWLVADFDAAGILQVSEALVIKAASQRFDAQVDLYRRWKTGVDDLGIPWANYFLDIFADGKAKSISTWADGYESTIDATWSIDADGTVKMTEYLSGNRVYKQRSWSLLGRTATQFFVMEHLQLTSGEVWRVNVYTDAGPAAP